MIDVLDWLNLFMLWPFLSIWFDNITWPKSCKSKTVFYFIFFFFLEINNGKSPLSAI